MISFKRFTVGSVFRLIFFKFFVFGFLHFIYNLPLQVVDDSLLESTTLVLESGSQFVLCVFANVSLLNVSCLREKSLGSNKERSDNQKRQEMRVGNNFRNESCVREDFSRRWWGNG